MQNSEALDLIAGLAWDPTPSGCWSWPGSTNRRGQPIVSVEGEGTLVQRAAYRFWRDRGHRLHGELRPNVPLVPACGNRLCVNPFHLRPGEKGLDPRGTFNRSKPSCPKCHRYWGPNLQVRSSGRRRCRACHVEELRRYRERKQAEAERLRQAHEESLRPFWDQALGQVVAIEPAVYRVERIA